MKPENNDPQPTPHTNKPVPRMNYGDVALGRN